MASQREDLQEDARMRVMRLIGDRPEMSTRQIANEVGISNGSAYYLLMAFVEKGFVKLGNFKNNPRKGQYAYILTPMGLQEKSILTHRFIGRKRKEYENLRAEIVALEKEVGISGKAAPPPIGQT